MGRKLAGPEGLDAATFCIRAAPFSKIADRVFNPTLRQNIGALARQYDEVANELEAIGLPKRPTRSVTAV
jgi:hypothetical protein